MKRKKLLKHLFKNDLVLLFSALFSIYFLIFTLSLGKETKREQEIFYLEPSQPDFSQRVTLESPLSDISLKDKEILFKWQAYNQQVQNYIFQISKNQNFTDILLEKDETLNSFNMHLADPGFYFWRIRAVSSDGTKSPWSLKNCFLLGPLNVTFNKPEPIKPFFDRLYFDSKENIAPINFKIEQPLLNESCFVYPKSYNIQISKNTTFEEPLYDLTTNTLSYKLTDTKKFSEELVKGFASSTFYWRARSLDDFEVWSQWSETASFTLTDKNISVF